MNDATWRVTHWIIDARGEAPMVEEFATADDGMLGPAVELEDIDFAAVDWVFVLKVMHVALEVLLAMYTLYCTYSPALHPPEQQE
jgi:hypothetical protein